MTLNQTSDGRVASELPLARQHVRAAVEMQIRHSLDRGDSCPVTLTLALRSRVRIRIGDSWQTQRSRVTRLDGRGGRHPLPSSCTAGEFAVGIAGDKLPNVPDADDDVRLVLLLPSESVHPRLGPGTRWVGQGLDPKLDVLRL